MIEPGKQHNLRVLRDATWTEDFNRLLAVNGLSANRLLNHLIQTGIATLDVTGQKGRLAIVTSEELNHLLERRAAQADGRHPSKEVVTFDPPEPAIEAQEDEPEPEKEEAPPRRPAIKQKNPRKVQVGEDVLGTFQKYQGE